MPPADLDQPHAAMQGMTPARTALFAIAAGLAVGNLYLAQPLIRVIAQAFGVPSSGAGMLVTATRSATRSASSWSCRWATSSTGAR
ncbi:MAG: hypothetical protein JF619_17980 [Massilia sp.]|nr:hypothetical protein [Massilia sp.]